MFEILKCMKVKHCKDCPQEIDPRSTRCYKCRSLFNPGFKGKTHSSKSRKSIGKASQAKFTAAFKERVYRSKNRGAKHRSINGYVLIKNYEHPNRNSHNDILEHILVMSTKIGRPLRKGEIVHHINCVRTDNREENLHLYASRSAHHVGHGSLNKLVKSLLDLGVIEFLDGTYQLKNHA